MQNGIAWNRTVLNLTVCKLMLNWIIWSRTVSSFNCEFILDRNKWKIRTCGC